MKKFRPNFQLYLLQIIQTMNNLTAGCWSVFEACHAWIIHTTILKASFAISERLKMLHLIRQRAVSLQLNRYDGIRIVKLNTDGIVTKTVISLSGLLAICLTFLNAWKQMFSVGRHFSEKRVHAYFTSSKFSEVGKS